MASARDVNTRGRRSGMSTDYLLFCLFSFKFILLQKKDSCNASSHIRHDRNWRRFNTKEAWPWAFEPKISWLTTGALNTNVM